MLASKNQSHLVGLKFKTVFLLLFSAFTLSAQFAQPFKWSANYADKSRKLTVSVVVPVGHYLYADQTAVKVHSDGKALSPEKSPESIEHSDEFGSSRIYLEGKSYQWVYQLPPDGQYRVNIDFQGCKAKTIDSSAVCFMPASEEFKSSDLVEVKGSVSTTHLPDVDSTLNVDQNLFTEFNTVKTGGGYLNVSEFLSFLDLSVHDSDADSLVGKGVWGILLFVILGGLALNLTPCVLPMIPINLAIIGAGSEAKSKMQGFIKGGIYGFAIALSYGLLGLFSVLTGAKFGSLNSSPIFNFIIAVIFILLALGMFDILNIDLSRFSARFNGKSGRNSTTLIAIFAMGVVAALLAGACVAPVVIAVLLYSTTVYAEGQLYGLFIPFLLGVGMALPWPIAGAGIAVMPKPGMWMVKVKYAFGLLIILFAIYYAYIGVELLSNADRGGVDSSFVALRKGLVESKRSGKPIFIDFWANWCKNCSKMESSTFKDSAVKKRLEDFVVIKFQAEDIKDPEIKKILDYFSIPGLPGFAVLEPKK